MLSKTFILCIGMPLYYLTICIEFINLIILGIEHRGSELGIFITLIILERFVMIIYRSLKTYQDGKGGVDILSILG